MRKIKTNPITIVAWNARVVSECSPETFQILLVEHSMAHFIPKLPCHINMEFPGHVRIFIQASTNKLGGVHFVISIAVSHKASGLCRIERTFAKALRLKLKAPVSGSKWWGCINQLAFERMYCFPSYIVSNCQVTNCGKTFPEANFPCNNSARFFFW